MANTTNFNWETPDDTDLVKDGAAAIRTLGNSIDTSFVDLKGGTTGQILSKASNTDLDYTWIANDVGDITEVTVSSPLTGGGSSGSVNVAIQDGTTAQKGAVQLEDSTSSTSTTKAATPNSVKSSYDLANAAIPKSLIDAEGDLIVGDAADAVQRLAIGSNGNVLTVDTSVDGKIKWAAPAGGGSLIKITRTSYSAVSTQAFDGVFTTTYKTYLVVIERSTGSSDNNLLFQFRDGSTTQNTLYYGQSFGYNYQSTLTNTATDNGSALTLIAAQGASGTRASSLQFYVTYVGAANGSGEFSLISGTAEIGNNTKTMVIGGGHYLSSADNDGFILSANTGTITGTVTVYGLAI